MELATLLHFELNGILCQPDLRARSIEFTRGDIKLRLDLPEAADSFDVETTTWEGPDDPRDYDASGAALIEAANGTFHELRVVRILASTDVADDWDEKDEQKVRDHLADVSTALVRDFCNWARIISKQREMPPLGDRPVLIGAIRLVRPTGPGEAWAYPSMVFPGGSIRVIDGEELLTIERLADVARHTMKGGPKADELLLVDSQYTVRQAGDSDPAKAVLLAAIALETRMRRAIDELSHPLNERLVEIFMANPGAWSVSAHALFAKVIPALLGNAPPDEWKSLAKRVQDLYKARNDVAHKGSAVERGAADRHVDTANRAFSLINAVVAEHDTTGALDA